MKGLPKVLPKALEVSGRGGVRVGAFGDEGDGGPYGGSRRGGKCRLEGVGGLMGLRGAGGSVVGLCERVNEAGMIGPDLWHKNDRLHAPCDRWR